MKKDELALKFKTEDAFGHFCARLTEEHMSFSLIGNRTIVVSNRIPNRLQGGFETLQDMGLVEILPTSPRGKRKLPTPQEADKILNDLTKAF